MIVSSKDVCEHCLEAVRSEQETNLHDTKLTVVDGLDYVICVVTQIVVIRNILLFHDVKKAFQSLQGLWLCLEHRSCFILQPVSDNILHLVSTAEGKYLVQDCSIGRISHTSFSRNLLVVIFSEVTPFFLFRRSPRVKHCLGLVFAEERFDRW